MPGRVSQESQWVEPDGERASLPIQGGVYPVAFEDGWALTSDPAETDARFVLFEDGIAIETVIGAGTPVEGYIISGRTAHLYQRAAVDRNIAPPSRPPSADTLVVAGTTSYSVTLSISAGVGATSRELHRSTSSGFVLSAATKVADLSLGESSYIDSGRNSATTYYYRTLVMNNLGSTQSNQVSATTVVPPAAPNPPSNLIVDII